MATAADPVQIVKNEVVSAEASKIQARRMGLVYEEHEFTLPTPSTDVTLAAAVNHATSCTCGRATGGFDIVSSAQRITIRNVGTATLQVRMGLLAADKVSVDAGETLDWTFVQCPNLYLSNASGVAINVRISVA